MINKKEKTIQSVIVGQDDLLYPTQPFQGNLCIFGVKERNLGMKFDTGSMKIVYILSLIKLYINNSY